MLGQDTGGTVMNEKLTAVFEKSSQGYIGYVEELPGANTQGATLEETKMNLIEAIQLVIEANRQLVGTVKKNMKETTEVTEFYKMRSTGIEREFKR